MHIVVASNPAARFGRSAAVADRVLASLGDAGMLVTHCVATSYEGLRARIDEALAERPDALVVVGGNDFATGLGIVGGEAAIRDLPAMLQGQPAACDLIDVEHADGHAIVAGVVSVGFDADVNVRSFSLTGVPSRIRYQTAIALTLARLRHRELRTSIDGGAPTTQRTVIGSVANNRTVGGGIPLVPSASMTDGLLTTITAEPLSTPAFLGLLAKAIRGAHESDPRVTVRTASRVEISSGEVGRDAGSDVVACGDGEILGRLPLTCTVMPGALLVFGTPS